MLALRQGGPMEEWLQGSDIGLCLDLQTMGHLLIDSNGV